MVELFMKGIGDQGQGEADESAGATLAADSAGRRWHWAPGCGSSRSNGRCLTSACGGTRRTIVTTRAISFNAMARCIMPKRRRRASSPPIIDPAWRLAVKKGTTAGTARTRLPAGKC